MQISCTFIFSNFDMSSKHLTDLPLVAHGVASVHPIEVAALP